MPLADGAFAITPAFVASEAARLAEAEPEAILQWALERYSPRVGLTCSFSGAGVVLAHLISKLAPTVPVIFLETGFHFPETLAFKEQFVAKYGLNLVELGPDPNEPDLQIEKLYASDPDRCCHLRKVEPMIRALDGLDAWVTSLRRDQSDTRAAVDLLEYHETEGGRPLVKVLPLARWSRSQVWTYILANGIPYHPLLDQGYKSIGCWPCTRPVGADESERAGRWSGQAKTECGLHTFTKRAD
jgi:phosphoadenosine phosphosulfate reductase